MATQQIRGLERVDPAYLPKSINTSVQLLPHNSRDDNGTYRQMSRIPDIDTVYKELKESRMTISNYKAVIKNSENCIATGKKELEEESRHLSLALQKIHNLEKEGEATEQKYRARIHEMMAREALAQTTIDEQRQEIKRLEQKLQAATIDCLNPSNGKPGTKRATNTNSGYSRDSRYRKCRDAKSRGRHV